MSDESTLRNAGCFEWINNLTYLIECGYNDWKGGERKMLRDQSFFDDLRNKMEKKAFHANLVKEASQELNERFNLPMGLLTDYMTLRVPPDDANDFVLYALSTVYFNTDYIREVFSDKEIKLYSKTKYKPKKLKYPLEFQMIQINATQWIGKITVQRLMEFRDAQIINYNERTQRTMERRVSHGFEYYKIAINDVAVREIEESYEEDAYIPNTITLNIADDANADFKYDKEEQVLRIKSLKYFDILDGYHRYRAMSKAYTRNPNFDYEMELRIVNFSEEHARQFIWQEDQKTKMSKVDSDSYNQNDFSVYICERVANNLPRGIISRNKGVVDFAELAIAVRYFFDTQRMKRSQALIAANELTQQFQDAISENPELFDTRWNRPLIYCFICACTNCNDIGKSTEQLLKLSTTESNQSQIWSGAFSTRKATALQKLCKEIERG